MNKKEEHIGVKDSKYTPEPKLSKITGKPNGNLGKTKNHLNGMTTNGRDSIYINDLQKRIDAAPMLEVEKLELKSMVSQIMARGIAFDVDSYIKKILIEKVKETDKKLIDYESDLISTQEKLSDSERNLAFHRKVLLDLKADYLKATDSASKKKILENIDEREEAIMSFQRLLNQTLELRNKIRKEIDKKDYNKAQITLREKELGKNVTDLNKDVDWSIVDV